MSVSTTSNVALFRGLAAAFRHPSKASLVPAGITFSDFEADYITLFAVGDGGRPQAPLAAGDYPALLDGKTRPELLLDHVNWYKHFGLSPRDHADLLPDHVVCQLEFLSWLMHLEQTAADTTLGDGYRRAQADFSERHLRPLMQCVHQRLQPEAGVTSRHFQALCELCLANLPAPVRNPVIARTHAAKWARPINLWD